MMASLPTAPPPGPVGLPDTAPVKRLTLLVVDSQLPVVEPGSCYNKDINTKLGTYYSLHYGCYVSYLYIQSIKIC